MRIILLFITLFFTISCTWLFRPAMSQATADNLMEVETGNMDIAEVDEEMPLDIFSSSKGSEDRAVLKFEDLDSFTIDSSKASGFASLSTPEVRIALKQKATSVKIQIENSAIVRSKEVKVRLTKGGLQFLSHAQGIILRAHGKKVTLSLPCTLFVAADDSWTYGKRTYAEKAIFTSHETSGFNLLNVLKVESYLRGVVPLEIGTRSEKEIEALKAQAVAARTYTYRRMGERTSRSYDLLPTVADQVYGGVGVAHKNTDAAILSTVGEVMVDDAKVLIGAFYHSTCAGHTAGIDEVWNSKYTPHLKGAPDLNSKGQPWCAASSKLNWTEQWDVAELSKILRIYTQERNATPFQGTIKDVSIRERTRSGRVKVCQVRSNHDTYSYGKDKVRQVFRRGESGNPILWSSAFRITMQGNTVTAQGKGFGHGIGMCQMGALGRSQGGQSYSTILTSYYTGVKLEKVVLK